MSSEHGHLDSADCNSKIPFGTGCKGQRLNDLDDWQHKNGLQRGETQGSGNDSGHSMVCFSGKRHCENMAN